MISIFLTYNLNSNEACFDYLTDVLKTDSTTLLNKYSYDIFKHTNDQRISFIAEELKICNTNILVGSAGYAYEDFKKISLHLNEAGLTIDTIFIPSESRRAAELREGQEIYRLHNRWIDFYEHLKN
jgi:hypothetical protein